MKHLLFALSLLMLVGVVAGQDIRVKGQVQAGYHELDMKANVLYSITVEAAGFIPRVNMTPRALPRGPADFNKPSHYHAYYVPANEEKNTIVIVPEIFDLKSKGPFDYQIQIKGIPLAPRAILEAKGELTQNDPSFRVDTNLTRPRHKSFQLQVKANRMYVIDMHAQEGSMLDPYLYLLDSKNKIVRQDDDSAGFPNARIVFQALKDGDYRIIGCGLGEGLGKFSLTVRATEMK